MAKGIISRIFRYFGLVRMRDVGKLERYVRTRFSAELAGGDVDNFIMNLVDSFIREYSGVLGLRVRDLVTQIEYPFELYDNHGNVLLSADSPNVWERSVYDARGLVVFHTDNRGYWERTERDKYGRVLRYSTSAGYWERRVYRGDYRVLLENSDGERDTSSALCSCSTGVEETYDGLLERVNAYVARSERDFDERGSVAAYDMLAALSKDRARDAVV